MKLKGLLIFLASFLAFFVAEAQDYNYRHYTTRNGLPSSMIYSVVQDDQGYMWFATDQGVVKFDGYRFRTYTVLDGLPDNDILQISKGQGGKLWFIAFSQKIAYYDVATDSIYPFEQYTLRDLPIRILERTDGSVWVGTHLKGIQVFSGQNHTVLDTSNLPLHNNRAVPYQVDGKMWIGANSLVFPLDAPDTYRQMADSVWMMDDLVKLVPGVKDRIIFHTSKYIAEWRDDCVEFLFWSFLLEDANIIYHIETDRAGNLLVAAQKGAILLPADKAKPIQFFLSGQPISKFFEDAEGNYWFTSISDGIYMLTPMAMQMENISNQKLGNAAATLFKYNGKVYFSTKNGSIGGWEGDSLVQRFASVFCYHGLNNCFAVDDKLNLCSSNYGIVAFSGDLFRPGIANEYIPIKAQGVVSTGGQPSVPFGEYYISLGSVRQSILAEQGRVWGAGYMGLFAIDIDHGRKKMDFSVFSEHRTTAICYAHDKKLWFSTHDSIGYIDTNDVKVQYRIDSFGIKGYATRIMEDPYGKLWFTTSGYGFCVWDGQKLHCFDTRHGLSSGFITSATWQGDDLILGTNTGLNMVKTRQAPPYVDQVFPLSINEALTSREIQHMLLDNGVLYVATTKGISKIPVANFQMDTTVPKTYLSRIQINERDTAVGENYVLPYYMNSIKLEYLALLYKADGNLQYRYQMEGIDTGWIQTSFTNVQYPALPPGEYKFKVDARSYQGPWSNSPAMVSITILPPFWQTWWFRALTALVALAIVIGISYAVIRYYRNQSKIAQRMVELEGQALRANMNPHFVFNALNAIHDFIANQDERSAHLYLGKFAQLIRRILDQSRRNFISLEEELDTLKLYLELENMRFEHKFEFQINIGQSIQPYDIEIPPMLIQPYLENAVRHGLVEMGRIGRITVGFEKNDTYLVCTITDNGIGRERAQQLNSKRLKKHRSVGMEITQKRVELLNDPQGKGNETGVKVVDLYDESGQAAGTQVQLLLPIKEL